MKEADFYEKRENQKVNCLLCPHHCTIALDRKGLCGVRYNKDGSLFSESYGKVASIALDPIEKKPLYHFEAGNKILSIGSYGCNFNCGFCQNHELSMGAPIYRTISPGDIAKTSKELVSRGNIGVAYTYNEPLIGIEFIKDCAELIVEQNQKNVLVTNGFICQEPLKELLPLIHAMNIDLKSFEESFYKNISGGVEEVKRTIETACRQCHVEVTTLIIPDENDSEVEMGRLSAWLAGLDKNIPLHISRFFPTHQYKDRNATSVEKVYRLVEIAKQHLSYVYAGNC